MTSSNNRKSAAARRRSPALERLEDRSYMAVDALLAVTGDWNGDGIDTAALVDLAGQEVLFKDTNATGFADESFRWREISNTSVPIAGDWNADGTDTIGLYDFATGDFVLRVDAGAATTRIRFNITDAPDGSQPIVGDWNGDGTDTIALFDAGSSKLYIVNDFGTGAADSIVNLSTLFAGLPSDATVVAGDFNPFLGDEVAVVSASAARMNYRSLSTDFFVTLENIFVPTSSGSTYDQWVAGDWDNDGDDELGGHSSSDHMFAIANEIQAAAADEVFQFQLEADTPSPVTPTASPPITTLANDLNQLTPNEVKALLKNAAMASASDDAIIAIVDRNGRILGVRIEGGVANAIKNNVFLRTFAIDGAIAKARTAAFFASGDLTLPTPSPGSPLTSRTIRSLSETTITEREVNSNPTLSNPAINPFTTTGVVSRNFGPGFVAPIGLGGHFPPGVNNAPVVDLFGIERQSRDGLITPGGDGVFGTADDGTLDNRFNVADQFIPAGKELSTPDSYGRQTGLVPYATGRGIATLPGGVPLYKRGPNGVQQVGGIGVFFPGKDGFAAFEQNFKAGVNQDVYDRVNAPRVLEAEFIAVAAAGGLPELVDRVSPKIFLSPLSLEATRAARIDLVGIQLETFGPRASQKYPGGGFNTLLDVGRRVGRGSNSGTDEIVTASNLQYIGGKAVPQGWLVKPHAAADGSLSTQAVINIVERSIAEAQRTRAAIRFRVNPDGFAEPANNAKMVIAVGDKQGNLLGLFRMPDATIFSIDVAVAKARNTAYYANPAELKNADKVDDSLLLDNYTQAELRARGALLNGLGNPDFYRNIAGTQQFNSQNGVALTNRTFRFLVEPRYPSGVDGTLPPIFSILNDHNINQTSGINPRTAENLGAANAPAGSFESVMGYDSFHVMSNFRDDTFTANHNGIVFFPGSSALYNGTKVIGGFGISGDGVDQDDVVTFAGQRGLEPPNGYRADQTYYRGVRLPYQKFNRNPPGGV